MDFQIGFEEQIIEDLLATVVTLIFSLSEVGKPLPSFEQGRVMICFTFKRIIMAALKKYNKGCSYWEEGGQRKSREITK